jgi:hypothetical protein
VKVAIMQPYFLPYIGYWQLIAAVDTFVILDDVNYINRGWINRNRIAVNGQPSWLTIPLSGASQNRLIREIDIATDDGWKQKQDRTITEAYATASGFTDILPLFEDWLSSASGNLSKFLRRTIVEICDRLALTTEIIGSSAEFPKGGLKGQLRILDLCRHLDAAIYINPPGGREIYDPELFRKAGIDLHFLRPDLGADSLRSGIPEDHALSILDLFMHNTTVELAQAVRRFDLEAA